MGTSLACVEVYLGDRQKEPAHRSVVEALLKRVLEGPYVETGRDSDPDPDPDREVLVGPLGAAPWLTVHDTQGDLRELARELSAAIDGTTVFVRVIDSNAVHLRRYSRGEMVDDYCSAPDVYDGYGIESDWPAIGEEELKALTRGDPAKWCDLLVEGVEMDRLREIWDSEPLLAQDILWATADVLAMDWEELDAEPGTQGGTRLTFRLQEPARQRLKADGPPRLGLGGHTAPREVYTGQKLDLQIWLQSEGGAATGMVAVAWGSAVEQGVVTLHKCVAANWADPSDRMEAAFAPEVATVGEEQRQVRVARFEALELPQGVAGGEQVFAQPGVNWRRAEQLLERSRIVVYLQGIVANAGPGELYVGFAPLDNSHDGQAVYHASLNSLPLPRRPLRCPEDQRAARASTLQQLERPNQLFAVVALSADRERSAQAAAEAIEAWVARVTRKKSERLKAYLGTRSDLRPSLLRLSAAEIPAGARWQEVREQLANCVNLTIPRKGVGLLYDTNASGFPFRAEALVAPQLGFWFDATILDAAEIDAIAAWLPGLVDGLMATGAGLQAMVGRWQWWNFGAVTGNLITTPYESACGIYGPTAVDSWCRRYLRGVTRQLWLGPDLVGHLGGTAGLAAIATVAPVGESVRVALNEGATLDELEEALAPLLPSEKDAREETDRLMPSREEALELLRRRQRG